MKTFSILLSTTFASPLSPISPVSLYKRQADLNQDEIQEICKDIDFCQGAEVETQELVGGTCNTRFQGDITPFANLATMRFTSPLVMQHFDINENIQAIVDTRQYVLTNFAERVMKPQELDNGRAIVSINMCVEQILDNAPGAGSFKGCQEANAQGANASASIDELVDEPGLYRVCGMPSTESGICPIMGKAQRSAEHDCQYFVVKEGGINGDNIELPGVFNECQISNGELTCNGQAVGAGNGAEEDEEEEEDPEQQNDGQQGNQGQGNGQQGQGNNGQQGQGNGGQQGQGNDQQGQGNNGQQGQDPDAEEDPEDPAAEEEPGQGQGADVQDPNNGNGNNGNGDAAADPDAAPADQDPQNQDAPADNQDQDPAQQNADAEQVKDNVENRRERRNARKERFLQLLRFLFAKFGLRFRF